MILADRHVASMAPVDQCCFVKHQAQAFTQGVILNMTHPHTPHLSALSVAELQTKGATDLRQLVGDSPLHAASLTWQHAAPPLRAPETTRLELVLTLGVQGLGGVVGAKSKVT
jgi:hypothetical protein